MVSSTFRDRLNRIIFKSDSKAGNLFDIVVFVLIIVSICFVVLESVKTLYQQYPRIFNFLHWSFTIVFTIEYLLRIYAAKDRWNYVTSFLGIIDLLAIVPSYIFFSGSRHLLIIRVLRLLRIFRIFQMGHFVREGSIVASALRASQTKIIVFLSFVAIASVLMGALMYMVEMDHNPEIQNIPEGIYWAIVTLTTVGYGDTVPVTGIGKFLASVVMVMGYGIIAVPTGIVTAEISSRVLGPRDRLKIKCRKCGDGDHLQNSSYCHNCGEVLPKDKKI
jgi:voltage-gated potassium channel